MSTIIETNKNKPGRKKRSYDTKPLNIRLDIRLMDRMNIDNIDKTALIHKLLNDYYKNKGD